MIDNPLPKRLRTDLQQAVHSLAVAEESALIAQRGGVEVPEQLQRIRHLKGAILQLLQVYDKDKLEHS